MLLTYRGAKKWQRYFGIILRLVYVDVPAPYAVEVTVITQTQRKEPCLVIKGSRSRDTVRQYTCLELFSAVLSEVYWSMQILFNISINWKQSRCTLSKVLFPSIQSWPSTSLAEKLLGETTIKTSSTSRSFALFVKISGVWNCFCVYWMLAGIHRPTSQSGLRDIS